MIEQRGKRRELRYGLADTHLNSGTLTSRAYNLSESVNSSIGVRAFVPLWGLLTSSVRFQRLT